MGESAAELKEQGNGFFKTGKIVEALALYDKALLAFASEGGEKAKDNTALVQQNRAACFLKLDKHQEALEACDAALEINAGQGKARYRRALALEGLGRFEEALRDVRQVLRDDPKEKPAIELARRLAVAGALKMNAAAAASDPFYVLGNLLSELDSKDASECTNALKRVAGIVAHGDHGADAKKRMIATPEHIPSVIGGISRCAAASEEEGRCAGLRVLHSLSLVSEEAAQKVYDSMLENSPLQGHLTDATPLKSRAAATGLTAYLSRSAKRTESMYTGFNVVEIAIQGLLDASKELGEEDTTGSGRELAHCSMDLISGLLGFAQQSHKKIGWAFIKARGIEALYRYVGSGEEATDTRLMSVFKLCIDSVGNEEETIDFVNDRLVPPAKDLLLKADSDHLLCRAAAAISLLSMAGHYMPNALIKNTAVLQAVIGLVKPEKASKVRCAGARTLASLCANKQCQEKLVTAGALLHLLDMATSQKEKEQAAAALALSKMSVLDLDTRQLIVEEGGLDLVTSLAASQESDVQKLAVEGLAFMCVSEQGDGEAREELLKPEILGAAQTLAGSSDNMVRYGLAQALYHATMHERVDEDDEKDAVRKLQTMAEGKLKPEEAERDLQQLKQDRADREVRTDAYRQRFVSAGGVRVVAQLLKGGGESSSLTLQNLIADILLALTLNKVNRGRMVQDGVLKCLLSVGRDSDKKSEDAVKHSKIFEPDASKGSAPQDPITVQAVKRKAAHAIARIGVTTNPNLFTLSVAKDCVHPLIDLTKGEDELAQFEAALALTNLASLGEDLKLSIIRARGMQAMEYLCSSDNLQVQKAAVGALCNLVTCEPILEEIEKKSTNGKNHVRIFLVLSQQNEEPETIKYAASALANLSGFPPAADIIVNGEGKGVEKLVGLLSCGVEDIVHPSAFAIEQIITTNKEWSAKFLSKGLLPPLLLLRENLPSNSPALQCVIQCLDALARDHNTPRSAREASGKDMKTLFGSEEEADE